MAYAGLSLEGKVALVTGSARGIGAALAIGLAEAGADVAVSDVPAMLEEAATTKTRVEAMGKKSGVYALDVLDLDNIKSATDQVVKDFGSLDILISNAGIRRPKPSLEVTEADWDDVWLSEGFATYFTLLFREHAYGRDDFVDGLKSSAERVFAQYEQDPDYRIVHDDLDDMSRVTSGATYQKGAWVLHMLRKRMGDEAFWSGIQRYYAAHLNGSATTDDFRSAMEQAAGEDLEPFFRQWLYQGGNPHLTGWWRYDPTAQAVSIEINQTQTNVGPFDLPLEVGIYIGAGERPTAIHTVHVTDRFHRFVIPLPSEPDDVRLDPDTWVLFRADFERR